jgi:putative transposase
MNKHNTILGQMIALISRSHFEKQVKEHKTEHGAKGLRSWTQFVAMLFSQLSGQHGLRSMEQGMNRQRSGWYHLGISNTEREVKRSTLAYANAHRSADLFKAVFASLLVQAQLLPGRHGFRFKNPLYSIDATTIDLCLKLFPWADFRGGKGGIKLTVKLDHQGKIPCFLVHSNAREHEVKKVGEVPYEPGDVLVFDRGYADYGYFALICEKKACFVTRLKKNAVYKRVKKHSVREGGNIISDYEIIIPSLSKEIRLRKIIARDPKTKKRVVLLTNNLKWSAGTVAGIYKDRWQIELFFKTIKQNLRIKRFYGNSRNAVMTQIWIAMIAYLLFYLLKVKSKSFALSFTNFISVIKTMLFQRVSLYDLLCGTSPPAKPKKPSECQPEFVWICFGH